MNEMFVHLLRTPDARYAIGVALSWPIYGALYIAVLKILDGDYAAAAGISWIFSYGVVYVFQKYGTFGAMSREGMFREVGHYAVAVVGLSAAVNFGLVTVLTDYDSTLTSTHAISAYILIQWMKYPDENIARHTCDVLSPPCRSGRSRRIKPKAVRECSFGRYLP